MSAGLFYSFVVFCDVEEASFPEYGLVFEHGTAAFNVVLDDVVVFESALKSAGVRVIQRNDFSEPTDGGNKDDGNQRGLLVGSSVLGEGSDTDDDAAPETLPSRPPR